MHHNQPNRVSFSSDKTPCSTAHERPMNGLNDGHCANDSENRMSCLPGWTRFLPIRKGCCLKHVATTPLKNISKTFATNYNLRTKHHPKQRQLAIHQQFPSIGWGDWKGRPGKGYVQEHSPSKSDCLHMASREHLAIEIRFIRTKLVDDAVLWK